MKKCLKCGWYLYEDPSHEYDGFENIYEYKGYICRDCLLGKSKNQKEDNCFKHQWLEGFLDIEGNMMIYECSKCYCQYEISCIVDDDV